jgi:hypothetical protein
MEATTRLRKTHASARQAGTSQIDLDLVYGMVRRGMSGTAWRPVFPFQ